MWEPIDKMRIRHHGRYHFSLVDKGEGLLKEVTFKQGHNIWGKYEYKRLTREKNSGGEVESR